LTENFSLAMIAFIMKHNMLRLRGIF